MPVFTISGNAGVAGATVDLTGTSSGSTTSAADGTYAFSGLTPGSYVVTPILTGVTFTPSFSDQTIIAADIVVVFVAQATLFSSSPTISDNFHRADSVSLGSNWTTLDDIPGSLAITSDSANSGSLLFGANLYTGSTFQANQFASATIGDFGASSIISIAVNNEAADDQGVSATLIAGGSTPQVLLDDSSGLNVVVSLTETPQPGDILSLQQTGSLATIFYNGVPIVSATTTNVFVGNPELIIQATSVQSDTTVTLFTAGPIDSTGSGATSSWMFQEYLENSFKRK